MLRKAFVMSVHPGCEVEYERRHAPIWPRLESMLRDHGVRNYSIFFDSETRQLFAALEIEDEERWRKIAEHEVCLEWWASMRDLMPTNADGSPVARSLREVFHLD